MNAFNKKMREKHKDADDARIYSSMMFDIVFYILSHEMNLDEKTIEDFLKRYNSIVQDIHHATQHDDDTFIKFIHEYVKNTLNNYKNSK